MRMYNILVLVKDCNSLKTPTNEPNFLCSTTIGAITQKLGRELRRGDAGHERTSSPQLRDCGVASRQPNEKRLNKVTFPFCAALAAA